MIINLGSLYRIKAENTQWILQKHTKQPEPNDWVNIGYYQYLENLYTDILDLKIKKSKIRSLEKLIDRVEEIRLEILESIEEINDKRSEEIC